MFQRFLRILKQRSHAKPAMFPKGSVETSELRARYCEEILRNAPEIKEILAHPGSNSPEAVANAKRVVDEMIDEKIANNAK